ncbi:MAG TPA: CCA tRNA nucleotidyltransferase [Kofleriaceae bacterium]|nr:CCA tRNA nucleotidyltransferase [Kofleriaceae bacterium]
MDPDLDRLDSMVPSWVREVCQRLGEAGHQAMTVGGAVRDAMLARTPGDWDVATSATPDAVMALFRRTLPTGIQHGTVTVRIPRGTELHSIEVTTFRGEGAYSDARRPDQVTFGVSLEEDLARRDFVVNAIAWDPIARRLHDPFGGRDDLRARRLRAVGVASERFAEDGLRILRAVRFVASLDFELEDKTEQAIAGALPSLARVSRERVRVELVKLLAGAAAERALEIAERTGILGQVMPEVEDSAAARARVSAAPPEAGVRMAALLLPAAPDRVDAALRRLTYSNAERARVVGLVTQAAALASPGAGDEQLRRALGQVGRGAADDLAALVPAAASRLRAIASAGDPLAIGELAMTGGDVMRLLALPPGPIIGRALEFLLARVLADPSLNRRETLESLLRDEFPAES